MARTRRDFLCTMEDLKATGAFGVEREKFPHEIVIVDSRQGLRAYVNSCPHKGTPLEMFPHKFLDETSTQLVCTTHGARFNVGDGICTFGPCLGEGLTPVKLHISGEKIYFDATCFEE